jgi:hypothetical protein
MEVCNQQSDLPVNISVGLDQWLPFRAIKIHPPCFAGLKNSSCLLERPLSDFTMFAQEAHETFFFESRSAIGFLEQPVVSIEGAETKPLSQHSLP